jgi:hypothetical protein
MTRDEARKLLEAYHTTDEYGISYYVQVTKFIWEDKHDFCFIGHPFSSEDKVDPTFAFEYYVDKTTGEISSADSPINGKKLKEMEKPNDQP